jgi:hypothetical protein
VPAPPAAPCEPAPLAPGAPPPADESRLKEIAGAALREAQGTLIERVKEALLPILAEKSAAAAPSLFLRLAPAVGLGGPVGLGLSVAGWFVGRALCRRASAARESEPPGARRSRERIGRLRDLALRLSPASHSAPVSPSGPPPAPQRKGESRGHGVEVVAVQPPPAPQQVITETQFTPVERDLTAEALAWAESEVVRKYPGSVAHVEFLRDLIKQYRHARQSTGQPGSPS